MNIETIKVVANVPGGYKVINKDDKLKTDKLYREAAKRPSIVKVK